LWIIDEIEGVLQFLVRSNTFKRDQALAALRAFKAGVASADQLIGMDAGLSDITLDWIKSIRGPITVKRYRRDKPAGKVTLLNSYAAGIMTIAKWLAKGTGPVYGCSGSEALLSELADYFSARRVLKITRDTSNTPEVLAFIRNENGERGNYDLVLYNSAMGAGVDISDPVDTLVGFFHKTPLCLRWKRMCLHRPLGNSWPNACGVNTGPRRGRAQPSASPKNCWNCWNYGPGLRNALDAKRRGGGCTSAIA
jgi:hypothetical protein